MMTDKPSLPSAPELRPEDVDAAARRLLIRRVFDVLGGPRGTLWWQTSHPDFGCAPLLKLYPHYDWVLHDTIFNATSTSPVFRTVGLVASRVKGAKEDEKNEGSAPALGITPFSRATNPKPPVWGCHDIDGSSSRWLALVYVQTGLEPPWDRLYEDHFLGCPMCIYCIEIARLTRELFPNETFAAQRLRRAVRPSRERY
jgi:hypothetical protein